MIPTQFDTTEITTTQANSTVVCRRAGDTKVPHLFGYITVLVDSAHVITFYDGEDNTGTRIAIKPASTPSGTYWFLRPVTKGLCAVVAASFAGNCIVGHI